MDKLKIAMVVAETAPIPDVLGGGAERLVTMLIDQNELEERVEFIVVSKYNEDVINLSKKYKHTKFIYIKNTKPHIKFANQIIKLINIFSKKKIKKIGYYDIATQKLEDDVDIIIDQNGYVREIGFLSAKYGKNRVLAHIHWKVNPHERGIDDLYGGVVGVSNFVADYWVRNSGDKFVKKMVVYSAVDENRFIGDHKMTEIGGMKNRIGISDEDVVFLYCGRLNKQKGIKELVEAFLNADTGDNIKLLVVGGSYLKNSGMTDYEKELHLLAGTSDNIIFTGYIDNTKLKLYYNMADVQVIPTIVDEAAGLVAIEGMICGLPIIATRSGGLREYIDDDCSIVVEKNDHLVENLTHAIERLYTEKKLRDKMSIASLNRANKFTQTKYYNDFVDCIIEYNCRDERFYDDRKKTVGY